MQNASRDVRPAELFAGAVWTVLIGATVIWLGYLAYLLTGRWSFFPRVLARGAIMVTVVPLLMVFMSAGVGALWEDIWGSDREPIGSGWLAKLTAGLCVVLAVLVAFAPGFAAGAIVAEMVRCLAFGSVALLASPSIEGKWRRGVATVLTLLMVVYVGAHTFELLAGDAPGFWSALLVAIVSPVLGYTVPLAIAFWLCRWTRGRLEARVAVRPAQTVDPAV